MVKPFKEEVPDYPESLRQAVEKMKNELTEKASDWAEMSLKSIASLEKDYFK
jgi:kinase-associated protein B